MEIRTSSSSPLAIAELSVPGVSGKLGLTLCPGKKGPSAGEHCWDRDLESDLLVVKDWPADAVITLLEEHEFELLDIRTLGQTVQRLRMEWFHFEIEDGDAPDNRFQASWPLALPRICDILISGKNILIHCRGGLGRTGTIAALILLEFGLSASDAIQSVRSVRTGAIETLRQKIYIQRYQPLLCLPKCSD